MLSNGNPDLKESTCEVSKTYPLWFKIYSRGESFINVNQTPRSTSPIQKSCYQMKSQKLIFNQKHQSVVSISVQMSYNFPGFCTCIFLGQCNTLYLVLAHLSGVFYL